MTNTGTLTETVRCIPITTPMIIPMRNMITIITTTPIPMIPKKRRISFIGLEDNRDCTEVLVQLAAVRSALNSTAKVILKEHMEHCMADAIAGGDMEELEALNEAIDRYIG